MIAERRRGICSNEKKGDEKEEKKKGGKDELKGIVSIITFGKGIQKSKSQKCRGCWIPWVGKPGNYRDTKRDEGETEREDTRAA